MSTNKRHTKYIFITGGVISGLGKGVTAAGICAILKELGQNNVTIRKLDPYLNVDPGTLNPFEHGEVFITRDGVETDLDLGYYERLGGIITDNTNSVSSGKLYMNLLNKERRGDYLGKTVQVIPHFTNEIKNFIRFENNKYDFIICEIGGSIGDIEAMAFYEALRQLKNEEDTMFIHITYIIYYSASDELKTKPTQNSLKELMQTGIRPDVLICRTEQALKPETKQKLSLYSNLHMDSIIETPNVSSIYKLPNLYIQQGLHEQISKCFKIRSTFNVSQQWLQLSNNIDMHRETITIGIVGKYVELPDSYCSLLDAINHACLFLHKKPEFAWINARTFSKKQIEEKIDTVDVIIVPGGFGDTGIDMIMHAIHYVRIKKIPFLGICLGMQLAVIEYARNVLHIQDANSTEFGETKVPIIAKMDEFTKNDELGGTMRLGMYNINILNNTKAHILYKQKIISERHRHRYDVNFKYINQLKNAGLIISGTYDNKLVEIIELPIKVHPFFIATQFHPEYETNIFKPHPLFVGLLQLKRIK